MRGTCVQVRNPSGDLYLSGALDEQGQPFQGLTNGETLTHAARIRNEILAVHLEKRSLQSRGKACMPTCLFIPANWPS
jgi:hypothetical protein